MLGGEGLLNFILKTTLKGFFFVVILSCCALEWLSPDGLVSKHNRPVWYDGRNVNCNR